MATQPPTVNNLINAFKDGITDSTTALLLYTDPKEYATDHGWHFESDQDARIGKFKAVTPAAYELARKLYEAAEDNAKESLLEDLSNMLCAASRTVNWSGLTEAQRNQTALRC